MLIARFSSEVYAFEPAVAFATPVTQTYARQARLVIDARSGSKSLGASPPMDADLALVRGADVFLIFIESYGAIELRAAGYRAPPGREPRRTRGGHPRHQSGRRVGVRRVADLRRLLVARAHQPDVGRRSPRRGEQREPDDAEARDAGDRLRAARLSHRRADAGAAATVAGRRVLRLRRHLRRGAARLSRAGVRLVRHSRSVFARALRRARAQPAVAGRRCSSSFRPSARTSRSVRRRPINPTGRAC